MPGCPFRFTLYLLLFPLVGTNIPARYGWYHVDHTAPVPPVRWYVFQCKMSHSYHWSHSDTRYLLRYTAKVSRTAEIAPTGELPSEFARQYAGRLLDCPIPFRYTAGYSGISCCANGEICTFAIFHPSSVFSTSSSASQPSSCPDRTPRASSVSNLTIAWLFSYS